MNKGIFKYLLEKFITNHIFSAMKKITLLPALCLLCLTSLFSQNIVYLDHIDVANTAHDDVFAVEIYDYDHDLDQPSKDVAWIDLREQGQDWHHIDT